MTDKLAGPMLMPASEQAPKQIVVLLHGYGSNGMDLISLGTHWRDILPNALFVAPDAPHPAPEMPGGYFWFSFPSDQHFPLTPDQPPAPEEMARAALAITQLLNSIWVQTGLGPEQTVLAGFSQGAMAALYTGLGLEGSALAIVGFSGILVLPEGLAAKGGPKPPICLVHGSADDVVDPTGSTEAATKLEGLGYAVSLHISEGARHTITEEGLTFAGDFLVNLVGGSLGR